MILDLDAGNSRVKWRFVDTTGRTVAWGAMAAAGFSCAQLPRQTIERVRVASVQAPARQQAMAAEIETALGVAAEFAETGHEALGVRNSYQDVSRMGVDRWLAMVASFQMAAGAVCVVDAGTSMTVDCLRDDGVHVGGYIVPGPDMMVSALYQGTDRVMPYAPGLEAGTDPGTSTDAAVHNGILAMLVGLVNHALACLADGEGGRRPALVVSGGGAEHLIDRLSATAQYRRDLVLDGLALANP